MFLGIPSFIIYIGTFVGIVLAGFFFFLGLFSRAKGTNIEEAEKSLNFVNSALSKKIEFLEKQVADQTIQLKDQNERLIAIEHENKLLREILQGRDGQQQEFTQKGLDTIQKLDIQLPEILTLCENTDKNVGRLCNSIQELINTMTTQTTVTTVTQPMK